MGAELFGVDIAGLIGEATAGQLYEAVVTRFIEGERTAGNLTGGKAKTPVEFKGIDGFWEDFTSDPPPGTELELGDRKAVLIGDTIPAGGLPERNDAITIEGETQYVVKLMTRDPAAAVYVFQCRDRQGPEE